jgi:geranylgeranyl pyrophosphate synthase
VCLCLRSAEAIELVKKAGSIEHAKRVSEELVSQSWTRVAGSLPPSEGKDLLEQLGRFVLGRDM